MITARGLLDGLSAIIFGGSSGLGRAVACRFAEYGARNIVVADVREQPREGGSTVSEHIARLELDVEASFHCCDIRSPEQVADTIRQADEIAPVDVVVNTAAMYWRRNVVETDIAAFDDLMSVNVRGALVVSQAAARRMIPRRSGLIINTGSGAGIRGSAGFSAYCASKGALRLLTHSLACELGPHGVRVNQVDPAYLSTAMTCEDVPVTAENVSEMVGMLIPLRRPSSLEEVALGYVYLASPLASYVNGHCLAMDGGLFTTAPQAIEAFGRANVNG